MREYNNKKLLVLGGIKLLCDLVERAQQMGVYVIVADYYEDSPAKKIADEAVLIDATDVDALVNYCKENHVDGVTTGFVDVLLYPCYEVCRRLGLPFYVTPTMLAMSTNKNVFKSICERYNIPVPKTYFIGNEIPNNMYADIEYPVFVKPLDASGSRGCGVCNNRVELDSRFAEAISYSKSKKAIIEEYCEGREFLLDYIAVDGEFRLLEMFDRYVCDDRGSAINYANVSMAPSRALDNYMSSMNEKVISMFKDLEFTDGLIFLQGHVNNGKITFYEMGCRLGGAFYYLEQECLGFNSIDLIINYALSGKMVDNINTIDPNVSKFSKYAFSCNYLLSEKEGTIDSVKGLDSVKQLSSYVNHIQERGVGFYNHKDTTMDKPVYTIYIVTDTIKEAQDDIEYMNKVISVTDNHGKSMLKKVFNPSNL